MDTAVTALMWGGVAVIATLVIALWVAIVQVWRDGR